VAAFVYLRSVQTSPGSIVFVAHAGVSFFDVSPVSPIKRPATRRYCRRVCARVRFFWTCESRYPPAIHKISIFWLPETQIAYVGPVATSATDALVFLNRN
jgi:hypothetical protein